VSDPKGHTILVMSGPEGPSLYLDDYRIAGPKPWGGGTVLHEFAFKDKDFIAAGVTLAPTAPDATHEWTTDDKHDYDWCRRCLLVRQANGSTDAKPCKGPAKVTLRAAPTPPDARIKGIEPHRYSPDAMAMGDCKVCGHVYEDHAPPVVMCHPCLDAMNAAHPNGWNAPHEGGPR
jgi:hypothetical protein